MLTCPCNIDLLTPYCYFVKLGLTWVVFVFSYFCLSRNCIAPHALPEFTYLGSSLSRAVHIDDEVTARTAKASVAFGRLRTNIWERNGNRLDAKLKVYKAVVLPTLLYACETWTLNQLHAKKLNHFHLSCLRKLLKIR